MVVIRRGVQRRMKIRLLSDLHLEFQDWVPPKSDADVIVLAGDIHPGVRGVEWARRSFPMSPVVYVPGNHEFYGEDVQDLSGKLFAQGRRLGVMEPNEAFDPLLTIDVPVASRGLR
jgi:predicted phosphodiesterase